MTTGKIRDNGYRNQPEYASIHLENESWMQRNRSKTVGKNSEEYKRSNEKLTTADGRKSVRNKKLQESETGIQRNGEKNYNRPCMEWEKGQYAI